MPDPQSSLAPANLNIDAAPQRETIGHRLRSPLHTILGYAGLLKTDASAQQLEQLGIIEDSARALLRSIDALPKTVNDLPFPTPQQDDSAPPASSGPVTNLRGLPGTDIALLRSLLNFGRLIEIERWAKLVGERLPAHRDTTRHIEMLARSANLPELQRLLQQCPE